MSNLTPQAQWDDVREIKPTDPVVGGPGGTPNISNQQLLNRTEFLKGQTTELKDEKIEKTAISNDINSNSITDVASSKAVKNVYEKAVDARNLANGKVAKADISSSVTSASTTKVASSKAVKIAYDKAVDALNAQESTIYKPQKRYRTGEIVFIADDDNVPDVGNYYEVYSQDGCLGKDPRKAFNRPDGWVISDPSIPYFWIKHGKWIEQSPVGAPVAFQKSTLNPNYIAYRADASLHVDKFWRLALVYPDLITGNVITIADLRAEFIRGLDDGRGIDVSRAIGSNQGDAIREITGYFRAANVTMNDFVGGAFSGTKPHSEAGAQSAYSVMHSSHRTRQVVEFSAASSGVPTAEENRPRNVAMLYACRF